MRDRNDNVVIVCSIENVDPMGVHTGDSVTVAPAMTLTDREYQHMRDTAIKIIRAVGVDTGGCNIQFAVQPEDRPHGRHRDEPARLPAAARSRPRPPASRSPRSPPGSRSATPSTRSRTTSPARPRRRFEPALDYVVVKIPRFAFEKFPGADPTLTTHMKSVGEAMAIGRSFAEALQKAQRSLESHDGPVPLHGGRRGRRRRAARPLPHPARRPPGHHAPGAARRSDRAEAVAEVTGIDPWFVEQLVHILEISANDRGRLRARHAACCGWRRPPGSPTPPSPSCAASGPTRSARCGTRSASGPSTTRSTPAPPSSRRAPRTCTRPTTRATRCRAATRPKVIILGSGPNRIGQGIEFDYSCVHASFALRAAGYETVMVNCNPETVSTDYDTSSRLYFEPLTLEDVLEVVHAEQAVGPGRRRDRAARRADAARPGARARGGGRADRRHLARRDPRRRGPRRVRGGARRRRG